MSVNTTEIHLVHGRAGGTCRVVTGASRRTYFSTPRAVGLALLASALQEEEDGGSGDVEWFDFLSAHGTAVGVEGSKRIMLSLIPRRERDVQLVPARGASSIPIKVSFPPVMIGMTLDRGRFVRGNLMLAHLPHRANWGVASVTPTLAVFPYGNVYAETGAICWGTVAHTDLHTIKDLEELFFGSGFNTDLFSSLIAGVSGLAAGTMPDPPAERFTRTFPQMIAQLLRS